MSAAAAVAFVVDTFMHTYITTVIMPLAGIHKHRYQLYHLYVGMYVWYMLVCVSLLLCTGVVAALDIIA